MLSAEQWYSVQERASEWFVRVFMKKKDILNKHQAALIDMV